MIFYVVIMCDYCDCLIFRIRTQKTCITQLYLYMVNPGERPSAHYQESLSQMLCMRPQEELLLCHLNSLDWCVGVRRGGQIVIL